MRYSYTPVSTLARYLLGAVRIYNGAATLFTPVEFARSLGMDPDANPAAIYMMRLFGVRALVGGAELLLLENAELEPALRAAPFVHASDVAAAVLAGMSGHLPPEVASKSMRISLANTALALLANAGRYPSLGVPRGTDPRKVAAVLALTLGTVALNKRKGKAQAQRGDSGVGRAYRNISSFVDAAVGWDRLPPPLGVIVLGGLRDKLRRRNLHDPDPGLPEPLASPPSYDPRYLTTRTVDGSHNDLAHPQMGMAGQRFGRNVPISETYPEPEPAILDPNPRTISRRLLTRAQFIPATSVNALVAPWLQFMIRDWFSHGASPQDRPWKLRKEPDDPASKEKLTVLRLPPDPSRVGVPSALPPTYINTQSPWWDASSIYGMSQLEQDLIRSRVHGKLRIDAHGLPPSPADPKKDPARAPGFWLGLAMVHMLFMREHNAICDRLLIDFPGWSDEELFQRARLINDALIAKIHTVEWTPAIISHPTTQAALNAQWWGFQGEQLSRAFGRLSDSELISGIPGSKTQHFGVPYSLTEEFTAVYRMHPLTPDDYSLRSRLDDRLIETKTLREIAGPGAIAAIKKLEMADLFYSFGTEHPGLVTLHNFPRFLQDFERPDGHQTDLAATDILRMREAGVPRYNEFRRLLGLKPAPDFASLTDNPHWAREIQDVYHGDIERVDLMVGLFAERRPAGFAFSDTAFRIFILMASRRLNSDRFFTQDYRPEIYTQAGMQWIADNSMKTVLLRHHPGLHTAMRKARNAFLPWTRSGF